MAVGDVRNQDKNSLVVVTADGWCYFYEVPSETPDLSLDEPITINEAEMGESIDEVNHPLVKSKILRAFFSFKFIFLLHCV